MEPMNSNSVFFVKLRLNNYGPFLGPNELVFDRHRTVIIGKGGTGKTIIANALSALGPAAGIKPSINAEHSAMSAEVVTRGDRELVKKYRDLIFLGCGTGAWFVINQETIFSEMLKGHQRKTVTEEARSIFQTMLEGKPWNIEAQKHLIPESRSMGEQICLGYAYIFAIRKALNLDLPAVFVSAFGLLDLKQRHGVSAFLKGQSCQQILLGTQYEFSEENEPHYRLESTGHYTKVRETTCDDR